MISAVLFDLDGTLLDIDIEPFLRDYFGLLGPVIAELLGNPEAVNDALGAVIAGTEAMAEPHPGRTNKSVFDERFCALTGLDLSRDPAARAVSDFYDDVFPTLKGTHGPREGASAALRKARELGLPVALATNPIFPLSAIAERARWAGFELDEFDFVTSYETMEACKPSPGYFRRVADELGVSPADCVMVGDDPVLDLAAADIGMRTFFVGPHDPVISDWRGGLADLVGLLPRIVQA